MAKAFIVGAGPGDRRLLTVAAAEAIAAADVILCDRLVSDEIIALAKDSAEIIYVGKHPGEQPVTQNRIFALFSQYANENKVLVRLKGGDPYVFGRGWEEHVCLKQLGYEVTLVPGITSAVGVPAVADIPLTARGVASAFAVVTGHCCGEEKVDWEKFAGIDTLVVLMGVSERTTIARSLIDAGRPGHEPVAFVISGSTKEQRVVRADLASVALGQVDVSSPAVFVIRAVTALGGQLLIDAPQILHELETPRLVDGLGRLRSAS